VCNFDCTTTVLCHVRIVGVSGMGMKAPDLLGAYGCSACHAYVDSNQPNARLYLLEGMARTVYQHDCDGVFDALSEAPVNT
jgi:hypothetical protein